MQALFVVEPFPVFPARAGMIPVLPRLEWPGEGIPRESGDDPPPRKKLHNPLSYSPRERG